MDKVFDFFEEHPLVFWIGLLTLDALIFFGAVLGVLLLVKAVLL